MKIINLIASFPTFVENRQVPQKNIHSALVSLAKIPYEVTSNPQNEAFYQLYEFIVAAIEYEKYFLPSTFEDLEQEIENQEPETEAEAEESHRENYKTKNFSFLKGKETILQTRPTERNITNSTQESHRMNRTRTSVSPNGDVLTTRETSRTNGNKNMNKSFGASKSETKRTVTKSIQPQASRQSKSPNVVKQIVKERQNVQDDEREESPEYVAVVRTNSAEAEWKEISRLDDTIETRNREAREYRSKAQRLLADHERYVNKMIIA